ncbi:hypothetical protein HanXRQr2_Chr17g0801101 [Helianthus annuus]|uniref:Uncharacterized protein n=1 Tax=Helianthus annuus TaxID=4232 RepID=A0A9K3DJJ3_HELAN|nr:hypothetical protein HanXRQr2_Chr17g0801101 [Helianthus annuus]KAJ0813020.1 hypothetical protein HanPSC8_Chr17g0768711 [Helianthus annuus]
MFRLIPKILALIAVQRQTAASRSASPLRSVQHGVFGGFPTTRWIRSLSKLAHTPNLSVSFGQVALGGEGVGVFGGEGVGGDGVGVLGGEGVGVFGGDGVGVLGGEGVGVLGGDGVGVFGGEGVGVLGGEGVGVFGGEGVVGVGDGEHGGGGGGGQPFGVWWEVTKVKKSKLMVRRKAVVSKDLEAMLVALGSYKVLLVLCNV